MPYFVVEIITVADKLILLCSPYEYDCVARTRGSLNRATWHAQRISDKFNICLSIPVAQIVADWSLWSAVNGGDRRPRWWADDSVGGALNAAIWLHYNAPSVGDAPSAPAAAEWFDLAISENWNWLRKCTAASNNWVHFIRNSGFHKFTWPIGNVRNLLGLKYVHNMNLNPRPTGGGGGGLFRATLSLSCDIF